LLILESQFYNEIQNIYTLEEKVFLLLREFANLPNFLSQFYNEFQNIYTLEEKAFC